jgi:hypothetical protein
MKKIIVIMMALGLVIAFAMPASAAATNASGIITFGTGGGDSCTYGLSNNVIMSYTSANNGEDYAIGDKHKSGNREYYTTNNTTLIYYFEDDNYKGDTVLNNSGKLDPTATSISGGTAL